MLENGLHYSDSRSATTNEFTEDLSSFDIRKTREKTDGGIILYRDCNRIYSDASDRHNMIVGNTGSMKTLRFVLPLLYSTARANESMIVMDPKGELAAKMYPFLKENGYEISILNWRNPGESFDCWNPMGRIQRIYNSAAAAKSAAATARLEEADNKLLDMIHALFNKRSHADKDTYWNESAGQVALGICRLLLRAKKPLTISNLLEMKHAMVFDDLEFSELYDRYGDDSVVNSLSCYLGLSAQNTKSCISSTFDQLVSALSASTALQQMMSRDTIQVESIGLKKQAIFMVVPDEKTTFHFIAKMFIKQCYEQLLDNAEKCGGSLPVRMNFILEEFCNIPEIPDIAPMLTAARSRNIRFTLVIQSYGQMVDKYGTNISKTILDNCGNLIYLHTNEYEFLTYISNLAGKNEYGRPFISTSRLQHLKRNETLIFHDRCYPFLVQDVPLIFDYPIKLGTSLPKKKLVASAS